ncbi:MAG: hypothetical protein ACXVJW_04015 [Acidimicrobiia bacterium]
MSATHDPDEPVKIPLDPEGALRALLQVKPDDELTPSLDVYASGGPGGKREWRISCSTCGWVISGTGERPKEADEAARTHRCAEDTTGEG